MSAVQLYWYTAEKRLRKQRVSVDLSHFRGSRLEKWLIYVHCQYFSCLIDATLGTVQLQALFSAILFQFWFISVFQPDLLQSSGRMETEKCVQLWNDLANIPTNGPAHPQSASQAT